MKKYLTIPITENCRCEKCHVNTSGAYEHKTGQRSCFLCNSLFISCPICRKNSSSTKRFGVIVCDSCKHEFSDEPEDLKNPDEAEDVILSGIRATGRLHFGNFIGAVRHFVNYQMPGNICMYFIADLHTLTTNRKPVDLRKNIMDIATDYLAAGLDPDFSIIYAQSSVPEITELATYLSMLQPLGELERIPTYKDLLRKNSDRVNLGLISYPVLMAADILGPQATIVPVGSDQRPNVELACGIARKFNNEYGNILRVPKFPDELVKVPGLDGEKMGKSESENAVPISATPSEVERLYLKRAITDENRKRASDPGNPFACKSVYPLHEILSKEEILNRTIAKRCQTASIGCVECKKSLVEKINAQLGPFQEQRRKFESDQDYVRDVLHFGGIKARSIIKKTVDTVREYMGITRF